VAFVERASALPAEIVRIGNSQGVRIPKPLREQAGLSGKVSMTVSGDSLAIRAAHKPRQGWSEAIARAARQGPEETIWPDDFRNAFDDDEWTW
jgi:antitoxin MazE